MQAKGKPPAVRKMALELRFPRSVQTHAGRRPDLKSAPRKGLWVRLPPRASLEIACKLAGLCSRWPVAARELPRQRMDRSLQLLDGGRLHALHAHGSVDPDVDLAGAAPV